MFAILIMECYIPIKDSELKGLYKSLTINREIFKKCNMTNSSNFVVCSLDSTKSQKVIFHQYIGRCIFFQYHMFLEYFTKKCTGRVKQHLWNLEYICIGHFCEKKLFRSSFENIWCLLKLCQLVRGGFLRRWLCRNSSLCPLLAVISYFVRHVDVFL